MSSNIPEQFWQRQQNMPRFRMHRNLIWNFCFHSVWIVYAFAGAEGVGVVAGLPIERIEFHNIQNSACRSEMSQRWIKNGWIEFTLAMSVESLRWASIVCCVVFSYFTRYFRFLSQIAIKFSSDLCHGAMLRSHYRIYVCRFANWLHHNRVESLAMTPPRTHSLAAVASVQQN